MRDSIVFYLNGVRQQIAGAAAFQTLGQWLREEKNLVGTKIVCNEGDCGACSVLVGRPNKDSLNYLAIDSCIAFLFQLDKTHVVTVEGLGGPESLCEVQQAMVDCHGSQCGFCTPGFVTTIQGLFEQSSEHDDHSIQLGLSGNLCRCTGYSQIMDAVRSIDAKTVKRLNERFDSVSILKNFDSLGAESIQIQTSNAEGERRSLAIPKTIDDVLAARSQCTSATMVAGATDYGVLFNHGKAEASDVICLTDVADFDCIEVVDGVVQIGGGATWTQIEAFAKENIPEYYEIITRFGSPQIRNAGTLAGNLAGGSPIGDSIPFHMVMDSELHLAGPNGTRIIKLADFYTGYRQNVMAENELIVRIATPLPKDDERVALYKISKRRDMDISTETLGVWIRVESNKIADARVAIGGVGPTVMRMDDVESFLVGETVSQDILLQAGRIARKQISPWTDVRGSDNYRLQLAENLLAKSFEKLGAS